MHPFQALFAGKSGCGNIHAMVERFILMYPGSEEPVGLRYLGRPSLVPGAYQRLVVGSPQMLFLFPAFPQRVWKRLMSWLRSAMGKTCKPCSSYTTAYVARAARSSGPSRRGKTDKFTSRSATGQDHVVPMNLHARE